MDRSGGVSFDAVVVRSDRQFDFYDGGGLDLAFLGLAQADAQGNLNVSKFGPRLAGAGGFINISQSAKKVVFVGTFIAGRGHLRVEDGALRLQASGGARKFVREVEHRTFSGAVAQERGQAVLYITERCVFRLCAQGLQLTEIAPGVDLQRDILALMDFEPWMPVPPVQMDARIFRPEPMQLRPEMLRLPLEARFAYDAERDLFFANFEGCTVRNSADVAQIRALLEPLLQGLGRKVPAIVNYDNFSVLPDALEDYVDMAREVAAAHYSRVSRYTTSAFLRSKLGQALRERGVAPHIFENADEAHRHLATLAERGTG